MILPSATQLYHAAQSAVDISPLLHVETVVSNEQVAIILDFIIMLMCGYNFRARPLEIIRVPEIGVPGNIKQKHQVLMSILDTWRFNIWIK